MTGQLSTWKGSLHTASIVATEIAKRWGEKEVQNYDPRKNCFTFMTWKKLGFSVKKGEKAIRSITFIEKEVENEDGDLEIRRYPRNVNLFYIKQVQKTPKRGGDKV